MTGSLPTTRLTLTTTMMAVVFCSLPAFASVGDPALPPPALRHQVRLLLATTKSGNREDAAKAMAAVIEQKRVAGIRNLTPVVAAWIGMFNIGMDDLPDPVRRRLSEDAIQLAPDYPGVYFHLASVRAGEGFGGIGPAIGLIIRGFGKFATFPRAAIHSAAIVSFYLQGVIVILFILGAFAFLFKYFSLFRHDLGDLFPRATAAFYTALDIRESRSGLRSFANAIAKSALSLLAVLILVAPFILGAGLLPTAAFWLFITFPYSRVPERVMSLLATALIACLPLLGALTALPAAMPSDRGGPAYWTCLYEYCPDSTLAHLNDDVVNNALSQDPAAVDSLDSRLALAAGLLQWSNSDPARLREARLMLQGWPALMSSAPGRVLHGNLLIHEALASCPDGHPDQELLRSAVASFETSSTFSPPGEAVFRGLAVANGLLGDSKAMQANLDKIGNVASDSDLEFMVRVRTTVASASVCADSRLLTSELQPPGHRTPAEVYFGSSGPLKTMLAASPRIPFKALLFGAIPPRSMPIALACTVVLGVVLVFIPGRSRRARRCQACGHVTCRSCNVAASGFDHCPMCLFDKVKPSFLDPEDVRGIKVQSSSATAKRIAAVLMAIVLPGSGQLVSGKPIRGITMLGIFGLGLEMVVFPVAPIIDSFAYIPPVSGGLPIVPPILLVLAWAWSLADVVFSGRK